MNIWYQNFQMRSFTEVNVIVYIIFSEYISVIDFKQHVKTNVILQY